MESEKEGSKEGTKEGTGSGDESDGEEEDFNGSGVVEGGAGAGGGLLPERTLFQARISLPEISVSIVNDNLATTQGLAGSTVGEVAVLTLTDLKVTGTMAPTSNAVEVLLGSIQLDDMNPFSVFPVVLMPTPSVLDRSRFIDRSKQALTGRHIGSEAPPFLHICLVHEPTVQAVEFFRCEMK